MSFTEQEIEEFKAEALELLETAEKGLLAIDEGADYQTAYNLIFRSIHNLKGGAGLMEFFELQRHTHELESLMVQYKGATAIPKAKINFFLRGIDAARLILTGKKSDFKFTDESKSDVKPEPPQIENFKIEIPQKVSVTGVSEAAVAEFISECEEIVDRVSQVLRLIESNSYKKENLEALYRDIHSLKGSAYLFSQNTLGDIAHAVESSLEDVRSGSVQPTRIMLDNLFKSLSEIEAEVQNIGKSNRPVAAANPEPLIKKMAANPELAGVAEKEAENTSSIRVPVSILDNLMTLMGEMVLVRNQVLQFSSQSEDLDFLNLSKRLNVVTSEIQNEMMKTRMQPIGNILNKFHRVVRDISSDLQKEITLNIFGADTELDKSLLEAIKDPLTHIVRNSCDHGIETPNVRVVAGKAKTGSLNIRSYHEGGQVVIEVSDDGKGLHKDTLLKRAIEKGLLSSTQAAGLGEKEILGLIFTPGFSTAETVTNLSGRGVGMDVVRTNVEKIGGTVELSSVAGKGTTTRLKIPLTLAIVPALIVKCGGESFAIPQVKLEQLVRVDQSTDENAIEFLQGVPVFRLRGTILPLVDLNKILGLPARPLASVSNIAVLNGEHCLFGIIFDEVLDTADIVVKPLNRLLRSLQVYSGATILGDGSISLIVDVAGIAKVCQIGSDRTKSDEAQLHENESKKFVELQEFLVVRVNSPTKHAIVLGYVHRLEEFKKTQIETSAGQQVVRYGKHILPIISISEQLGYGKRAGAETKDSCSVVVVQKSGVLYGLEVDEIVDTLSTDSEVETALVRRKGVFGNLNTAEELIVAVDPFEIINSVFKDSESLSDQEAPVELVAKAVKKKVDSNAQLEILLVDDTVFFRKNVAKIFEKAGHQVTLAVDGIDAIAILEKDPKKFQIVVSDIEMPRMNGFELAQAIRSNQNYASLPLLALSSRADKDYMQRGLEAGFDIYLEKLQPEVLLNSVNQLVKPHRKAV